MLSLASGLFYISAYRFRAAGKSWSGVSLFWYLRTSAFKMNCIGGSERAELDIITSSWTKVSTCDELCCTGNLCIQPAATPRLICLHMQLNE